MAKRGRKPTNKYKVGYFYEDEEKAVSDYIKATTVEQKNKIFEDFLKPALKKMIESIIRRYNLYPPGEEFEETFADALSHIIEKIDRFNDDQGTKAFSYLQTVCKNHLICKINNIKKMTTKNTSYDDMFDEINDNEEHSYVLHDHVKTTLGEAIQLTAENILELIGKEDGKLSKKEILVGKSISEILLNWDELFKDLGSNKFNRSAMFLYIKETTNLSTKDVNASMRKFKNLYFKTKNSLF